MCVLEVWGTYFGAMPADKWIDKQEKGRGTNRYCPALRKNQLYFLWWVLWKPSHPMTPSFYEREYFSLIQTIPKQDSQRCNLELFTVTYFLSLNGFMHS